MLNMIKYLNPKDKLKKLYALAVSDNKVSEIIYSRSGRVMETIIKSSRFTNSTEVLSAT